MIIRYIFGSLILVYGIQNILITPKLDIMILIGQLIVIIEKAQVDDVFTLKRTLVHGIVGNTSSFLNPLQNLNILML